MSVVATHSRMVTVTCGGCGDSREVTIRQSRRAGLCSLCRTLPRQVEPSIGHLRFWFRAFDDAELAELLSMVTVGPAFLPEKVGAVRLALIGEEDARPARLLSSVPQQAGLIA